MSSRQQLVLEMKNIEFIGLREHNTIILYKQQRLEYVWHGMAKRSAAVILCYGYNHFLKMQEVSWVTTTRLKWRCPCLYTQALSTF